MDLFFAIVEIIIEFLIELIPVPRFLSKIFGFLGLLFMAGLCIFLTINGLKIEWTSTGLMVLYWVVVIILDSLISFYIFRKITRR